jgi:hypothetical protein
MRAVRIITRMVIRAPLLLMIGPIVGGALDSELEGARTARLASEASDAGSERSGVPDAEPSAAGAGAPGRAEPTSRVPCVAPPSTIMMRRVGSLFVNEDDDVSAGQPPAEFAAAARKRVAAEHTALAEAQTRSARVRVAGRPEDIDAGGHRASLHFHRLTARSDADRAVTLVPGGAGARAVAERAAAAANRTAAELREPSARVASPSRPRLEDVGVVEAKIRSVRSPASRRAPRPLSPGSSRRFRARYSGSTRNQAISLKRTPCRILATLIGSTSSRMFTLPSSSCMTCVFKRSRLGLLRWRMGFVI